jgi:Glycosyl transferases group 1
MIYLLISDKKSCIYIKTFMNNFQFILNKNGIQSEIRHEYDSSVPEFSIWFCLWNGFEEDCILPPDCIIYNFEPFIETTKLMYLSLIKKSQIRTFINYSYQDETEDSVSLMVDDYRVIPYGYSSYNEYIYNNSLNGKKLEKSIDILFYGESLDKCRLNTWKYLVDWAISKNYNYQWLIRLYDDKKKSEMVASCKVYLSIAGKNGKNAKTNDLSRLSFLICNKIFIIAEKIGDKTVEDKLEKYIEFFDNTESMLKKLEYYLAHEEERQRKAEIAYEKFKEDFPLEKDFLELIKERVKVN